MISPTADFDNASILTVKELCGYGVCYGTPKKMLRSLTRGGLIVRERKSFENSGWLRNGYFNSTVVVFLNQN